MLSNDRAEAQRKQIVVVDDDELFRESLIQNLSDSGFEVAGFGDGNSALVDLDGRANGPDLVLLDWKMPEMSGIEVLKRLRDGVTTPPVIFLTALSDQIYEEAALIGGAVDFVEKSRSYAILLRRIELILDGPKGKPDAPGDGEAETVVRIGELELHGQASRARWRGERVELSLTEFTIVQFLVQHAGRDVRYRDLYDLVRGRGFVAGTGPEGYRANVRTFIKRIRQKFREVDDRFDEIENYPGFGYRWRGDDTEVA